MSWSTVHHVKYTTWCTVRQVLYLWILENKNTKQSSTKVTRQRTHTWRTFHREVVYSTYITVDKVLNVKYCTSWSTVREVLYFTKYCAWSTVLHVAQHFMKYVSAWCEAGLTVRRRWTRRRYLRGDWTALGSRPMHDLWTANSRTHSHSTDWVIDRGKFYEYVLHSTQ